MQQKRTRMHLSNERVLSIFTLNRLWAGHWVRIDYYIMPYWLHVPIIVQCQCDGCSLSSKDGAVIWQSSGQLLARCLTNLEIAVDDHRSPDSLVYLGSVCVNFIMWPMSAMILFEFDPGFLSGDHTFAQSFNEFVSRWVIFMRTWRDVGFPQRANKSSIDLCRGSGCLYPKINRTCWGSSHASFPFWPGNI